MTACLFKNICSFAQEKYFELQHIVEISILIEVKDYLARMLLL